MKNQAAFLQLCGFFRLKVYISAIDFLRVSHIIGTGKEFFSFQERMLFMNLAKISSNGQITVPVEIRRLLGLKSGDKILFYQTANGEIVLSNASASAIRKVQAAFSGAAKELNVGNDEDVQALVNEARYGRV